MTRVVNLYKESYDVYIGRRNPALGLTPSNGYFGNPFPLPPKANPEQRQECLDRYRRYFMDRVRDDADFRRNVLALEGKVLGCFCKPKECHGDVIVEFLLSKVTVALGDQKKEGT